MNLAAPDSKRGALYHKIIAGTFYALIIIFLVLYLKNIDFGQFENVSLNWTYLLLATFFGLTTLFWGTFIWFTILRGLGARNLNRNKGQLVYVYSKSWLGRYIPGTAPWILGKIYFASRHGISKNKLAISSLLEAGLQVLVTLALSFSILLLDSRFDVLGSGTKIVMAFALIACFTVLIPTVFNKVIAFIYRLLKKKELEVEHLVNRNVIIKGILMYAVGVILNGLALFFIAKGVYPELSNDNLLFVMSVGNLAGALGMLAIFVPSGLGVREGVQLVLLSLIMPVEFALLVTIASRIWTALIDLLFFGVGFVVSKQNPAEPV